MSGNAYLIFYNKGLTFFYFLTPMCVSIYFHTVLLCCTKLVTLCSHKRDCSYSENLAQILVLMLQWVWTYPQFRTKF